MPKRVMCRSNARPMRLSAKCPNITLLEDHFVYRNVVCVAILMVATVHQDCSEMIHINIDILHGHMWWHPITPPWNVDFDSVVHSLPERVSDLPMWRTNLVFPWRVSLCNTMHAIRGILKFIMKRLQNHIRHTSKAHRSFKCCNLDLSIQLLYN